MNVYKVVYHHPDEGACLMWASTKAEAKQLLKDSCVVLCAEEGLSPSDLSPRRIEPMNIPTDKDGLLRWLNLHFTRENG